MTTEQLEQRWRSIVNESAAPYRSLRISPDCIPELYIALDMKGNRYLILQVPQNISFNSTNTELQNVSLQWHEETRFILIGLLSNRFIDLFNDLALSLYNRIKNVSSANNYTHEFINSFQRWAEFFEDSSSAQLSNSDIQGIFGELIVMKEYLKNAENSEADTIVSAWQGPYNRAQDFYFSTFNLEVKTKDLDQIIVRISSEYQLQPEQGKELKLAVVDVLRHEEGLNIQILIQGIKSILSMKGADVPAFLKTLLKTGLNSKNQDLYNNLRWQPKTITFYNCTDNAFPKIISSELENSISAVKYNLSVNLLSAFITQTIFINGA